jgi:hypothetical protein
MVIPFNSCFLLPSFLPFLSLVFVLPTDLSICLSALLLHYNSSGKYPQRLLQSEKMLKNVCVIIIIIIIIYFTFHRSITGSETNWMWK